MCKTCCCDKCNSECYVCGTCEDPVSMDTYVELEDVEEKFCNEGCANRYEREQQELSMLYSAEAKEEGRVSEKDTAGFSWPKEVTGSTTLCKINDPQKHREIRQMAWELHKKLMSVWLSKNVSDNFGKFSRGNVVHYSWECAEEFYSYAKEKEEGSKSDKEFPKCYVCGQKLSGNVYAVDICGHKYCSKECVLEAEG